MASKEHPQAGHEHKPEAKKKHDDPPSQHDGGVGNLQDEPRTAEEAKKRASEGAPKKHK